MARTKAQLKKLHRELWQWLADNPDKWKEDWPSFQLGAAMNDCFACEAAGEHKKHKGSADCRKCPAQWGYDNSKTKDIFSPPCTKKKSPFYKWEDARFDYNKELATKYALLVRDAWK